MVAIVNDEHLALCSSREWANFVENELLPWVLDGYELGDDLLEVGPGPGLTTDILRRDQRRMLEQRNVLVRWAGCFPHQFGNDTVIVPAGFCSQ
jgi:hypothetical protein